MASSKKKTVKKAAPKKKPSAKKKAAAEPVMNQENLKKVVVFHLSNPNLNPNGIAVDDNTVLNTILSPSDGFGTSNSQDIFRYVIEGTFSLNGFPVPPFPEGWMGINVAEFTHSLLQ